MNLWSALRRLLPFLAVFSLALTPMIAPAATAGMHASMARDHLAAATGDRGMPGMDHAIMDHAIMDHPDAGSVDRTGSEMDGMPCCPTVAADEGGDSRSACAKGCPLMTLCLTSVVSSLPPVAVAVPLPAATRAIVVWPDPTTYFSVHGPPPPEPPRA